MRTRTIGRTSLLPFTITAVASFWPATEEQATICLTAAITRMAIFYTTTFLIFCYLDLVSLPLSKIFTQKYATISSKKILMCVVYNFKQKFVDLKLFFCEVFNILPF